MAEEIFTFIEQLATSLGSTISQLINAPVEHRVQQGEASAELWANALLTDGAGVALAFSFSRATGLFLARALLSEPVGEARELNSEDRELLVEFWKQAFGRASTDLRAALHETSLEYSDEQKPEWTPATEMACHFHLQDGTELAFGLRLSLGMVKAVSVVDSSLRAVSASSEVHTADNLDLLLEVPLAVSLRFGQRLMPLRDVLQLASGAVVELDRKPEDAVDLLLDERLIARGQVVVVDGCYGLRVTEVCR